ncbi:squalene/phytoene synthase family protein [Litoreibacter arenae]|uniref:Putative Phytoene/squalene synthetase n=1 Tax=Litoreibacter arenae DSM 19593 TaxID=1123360 RepID=S9QC00_9RHOB|nr:squalene/phytoene synthase family protein [Litoreibacter arenae]EPX78941.1 putative Phytoene/squalene synthetase [Litoreibacter arenae DSM 19593]
MSLEACRSLVERADPERFSAAQLGTETAQKVLWPLYAMNVEVSRAPWVTQEPMIAEMRLQWWRDALEEIAEGKPIRAHEVTTALGAAIGAREAALLDELVQARRWDIYKDGFDDEAALLAYLDNTAGLLMWAGALALGAPEDAKADVIAYGRAAGLARFLQAAPELEARGRRPLVDGTPEGVRVLCKTVLSDMPKATTLKRRLGKDAASVITEGWQTRALLQQAIKNPTRVAEGALGLSEFGKRWRLLLS